MELVNSRKLIGKLGIEHLQSGSVFGALSPKAVEFLLTRGRVFHLQESDVVYEPGDKGDRFFIILSGKLALFQFHLGEYAFIRDHGFGEEIGFVAMIALHERMSKVIASEDSLILEISFDVFNDLHQENPKEFGVMLMNLSREMARSFTQVSNTIVEHKITNKMFD